MELYYTKFMDLQTMGTSAVMYVYEGGKRRFAILTNFDGYPSHAGANILGFVCNRKNVQKLRDSLNKCVLITPEEREEYRKRSRNWEYDYAEKHPEYTVAGDAEFLQTLVSSKGSVYVIDWSNDMRFSDWAYVIDLDRNTFEVYKGMNRIPLEKNERFYDGLPPDNNVYPFKEVAVFDMDDLPSNDEFLEKTEK